MDYTPPTVSVRRIGRYFRYVIKNGETSISFSLSLDWHEALKRAQEMAEDHQTQAQSFPLQIVESN